MGALLSYVLVPEGATTRLLLEIVVPEHRWYGRALALGDWPMARRQLLDLKHLAEAGDGGTQVARRAGRRAVRPAQTRSTRSACGPRSL
jgi:hypothetical protein